MYLVAGIAGFIVTGLDAPLTGLAEAKVVILAINPLHNIIHLALGGGYAIGAVSDGAARYANLAIGTGFLAAFVLGLFGGPNSSTSTGSANPTTGSIWSGDRPASGSGQSQQRLNLLIRWRGDDLAVAPPQQHLATKVAQLQKGSNQPNASVSWTL